jgi:uncharacterized protein
VLVLVAASGVGWYFSDMLRQEALLVKEGPPAYDLVAASASGGTITLQTADPNAHLGALAWDGIWGLQWDDGYGSVGPILSLDGNTVVRGFELVRGTLAAGQPSRLDQYAFDGDPALTLGLEFDDVMYASELGDYPAWSIPGERDTWAIFVHGWGDHRGQSLRMLPAVVEQGYPSLVITYRNDEGTPPNPDGRYWFGATEWRDVEAAVQYALDNGASDVVLVGYSMGGGAILNFLYRSPLVDSARSAVFDAPVLSFYAVVVHEAAGIGITGLPVVLGKWVASWRFGLDWGSLAYLDRVDELDLPVLLFHGDADERSPVWTSDAFAEARPDIVTYIRVPGATHVRAWNMDPDAYGDHVRAFLGSLR